MSQNLLPIEKALVTITTTERRQKCEKQWEESCLEEHLFLTEIAMESIGPQHSAPCALLDPEGNSYFGHTKHALSSDVQMIVFGVYSQNKFIHFILKFISNRSRIEGAKENSKTIRDPWFIIQFNAL